MEIVQLNANAKLSEHLASPSEAALGHSNKLDGSHLSPNFTLGEFTKSGSHPEVYNIPSHEAIANLKRLCTWLEELRARYNDKYVAPQPLSSRPSVPSPSLSSRPSAARGEISQMRLEAQAASRRDVSTTLDMTGGGGALDMTSPSLSSRPSAARGEIFEEPIRLNSGYRSPQLNRAIHGNVNSNHMTGCAADIRVSGMEQLLRYAVILLDYADESKQDFDELLIEKNRYGAIWLHFAVRPSNNRRQVNFLNA